MKTIKNVTERVGNSEEQCGPVALSTSDFIPEEGNARCYVLIEQLTPPAGAQSDNVVQFIPCVPKAIKDCVYLWRFRCENK